MELTFKDVGTVSYPKKFGNIKFPITNIHIPGRLNYLEISSPLNSNLYNKYYDWCIDNGAIRNDLFL